MYGVRSSDGGVQEYTGGWDIFPCILKVSYIYPAKYIASYVRRK